MHMSISNTLVSATVLLTCLVLLSAVNGDTGASKSYQNRDRYLDPKKRPFCNAFTGCGRKRSNIPATYHQSEEPNSIDSSSNSDLPNDESISTLLGLNSEPAVEELSRQIMSEAKLWEAIQEANMELLRRKQDVNEEGNRLLGLSVPANKCGANTACFI